MQKFNFEPELVCINSGIFKESYIFVVEHTDDSDLSWCTGYRYGVRKQHG